MDLSGNKMTNVNGMVNVLLTSLKYNVSEMIYNMCYVWNWIDEFNDIELKHKIKLLSMSYGIYVMNGDNKYHVYDLLKEKLVISEDEPLYKIIVSNIFNKYHKICSIIEIDFDLSYQFEPLIDHGSIIKHDDRIMVVSKKPFSYDLIDLFTTLSPSGEKTYIPARISKYINEPWKYYYKALTDNMVNMIELNPTNSNHLKFINKVIPFQPNKKYMIDDDLLYQCTPVNMSIINFYSYTC